MAHENILLNLDCLEHIFKYLGHIDLVNVAHTSTQFKEAAELAYSSKHKRTRVIFGTEHLDDKCDIKVGDTLISLRLLRCFGQYISSLRIWYDYRDLKHLDRYVNEYCANSLTNIEIVTAPTNAMEHLTKPFTKIETVQFTCSCIIGNLTKFNQWFPKMRRLEINNSLTIRPRSINEHFPHLEELRINHLDFEDYDCIQRSNIAEVVRLNPQLKNLMLGGRLMSATFIQSISEHLQRVETLVIQCDPFFEPAIDDIIHFQNVKYFTLWYPPKFESMPKIPFSFDKIEILTMRMADPSTEFLNFIGEHQSSLTRLNLGVVMVDEAMTLLRFLNTFNMLKKISFLLHGGNENDLRKCVGKEWRWSTEGLRVLLER